MKQKLLFTNSVDSAVDSLVNELKPSDIFVLTDTNTALYALPLLKSQSEAFKRARYITTPAGDMAKNLDALSKIWTQLQAAGATRHSLLICLGGGMVTDLGGLAAATYKRGMSLINIPTTLLGAVDASVGGKTAINFGGIKNLIGTLNQAHAVIISTIFLNTLPIRETLSGYAEMLKHGLLKDEKTFKRLLAYNVSDPTVADPDRLLELVEESVLVKQKIVDKDPEETGIRKALNLGHTIGHAFESLAMKRLEPIPHGFAVAHGLVVEAVLSHMLMKLNSDIVNRLAAYVKENYGILHITCDDYPELIAMMRQDKKNDDAAHINFTLLRSPGTPVINTTVPPETITAALDIYRDLLGI
jgi:3-dehydroquinate synthase